MSQRQVLADQIRIPAYINVEAICQEYAPYHENPAFTEGFCDYLTGKLSAPHRFECGQAYDRGYEAGMRVMKFTRWISENVGAN